GLAEGVVVVVGVADQSGLMERREINQHVPDSDAEDEGILLRVDEGAEREVLDREVGVGVVGGFHPGFELGIVGFVDRVGHGGLLPAPSPPPAGEGWGGGSALTHSRVRSGGTRSGKPRQHARLILSRARGGHTQSPKRSAAATYHPALCPTNPAS